MYMTKSEMIGHDVNLWDRRLVQLKNDFVQGKKILLNFLPAPP